MIRLLHIDTLEFKEFQHQPPPYATTSHRWQDGEEVTMAEVMRGKSRHKRGFAKIQGFCAAIRRMYELSPRAQPRTEWIWIDTCCINKANFTELSEAITSMFRWYAESSFCLAYLHDVGSLSLTAHEFEAQFRNSEWWQRGWTLQELLAPELVVLFNSQWQPIGHKSGVEASSVFTTEAIGQSQNLVIEDISGISRDVLADFTKAKDLDVSIKKSWMDSRVTTRLEDRAYCQLGIFDVFMPLIYGERENTMTRLEEILQKTYISTKFSTGEGAGASAAISGLVHETPLTRREERLMSPFAFAEQQLADAARSGNAAKVARVLKTNVDVDAEDQDQETALHKAAKYGYSDVARVLIDSGAFVDPRDSEGKTPLHLAVSKHELEVAEVLIKGGADVNSGTKNKTTPLETACLARHYLVIDMLLAAGARTENINQAGDSIFTKLINERMPPDRIMVKQLTDRGANVNHIDRWGTIVLHRAVELKNLEWVKLLLAKGAEYSVPTQGVGNPLFAVLGDVSLDDPAVSERWGPPKDPCRKEILSSLLKAGADVNGRNMDGWTPLLLAVRTDCEDLVSLLLDAGADMNAERDGKNALNHARSERMKKYLTVCSWPDFH